MKRIAFKDTAIGLERRGGRLVAVKVTAAGFLKDRFEYACDSEPVSGDDIRESAVYLLSRMDMRAPVVPVVSGCFHGTIWIPLPDFPFPEENLAGCSPGGSYFRQAERPMELVHKSDVEQTVHIVKGFEDRCPGVAFPGRALAMGFRTFVHHGAESAVVVDRNGNRLRIVCLAGDRLLYARTARRVSSAWLPEIRITLEKVRRDYPFWNPTCIYTTGISVQCAFSGSLPPFQAISSDVFPGGFLAAAGAAVMYVRFHRGALYQPPPSAFKPVRRVSRPVMLLAGATLVFTLAAAFDLGTALYERRGSSERREEPSWKPAPLPRDVAREEGRFGFEPYDVTALLWKLDEAVSGSSITVDKIRGDGFRTEIRGFSGSLADISLFSRRLAERFNGENVVIRRSERIRDGRFSFHITIHTGGETERSS